MDFLSGSALRLPAAETAPLGPAVFSAAALHVAVLGAAAFATVAPLVTAFEATEFPPRLFCDLEAAAFVATFFVAVFLPTAFAGVFGVAVFGIAVFAGAGFVADFRATALPVAAFFLADALLRFTAGAGLDDRPEVLPEARDPMDLPLAPPGVARADFATSGSFAADPLRFDAPVLDLAGVAGSAAPVVRRGCREPASVDDAFRVAMVPPSLGGPWQACMARMQAG